MPCRVDPIYTEDELDFEAVLCGVFTVLEGGKAPYSIGPKIMLSEVLQEVDWNEVGEHSAFVVSWWEKHKERDRQRRIREKKEEEEKIAAEKKKLKELIKKYGVPE